MTTPMIDEPEHYRLAPSSAYRWLICPASAGADGDEESDASKLGTRAHETLNRLLTGEQVTYEDLREGYYPDSCLQHNFDSLHELLDCVGQCAEFVRSLPGQIVGLEHRVKHAYIDEHGGTIDVVLYDSATKALHIVDYKHGLYEVFATDNAQLKCYLNLARQLFPAAERFFGTIFQPRVKDAPDTVEFSRSELDDHQLAVMEASVGTEYVAGGHCQWCPLLMRDGVPCPAAFDKMREQASIEFDEILEKPMPERIAALEGIIEWGKVAVTMTGAAKDALIQFARNGATLDRLKVVYSWTRRAWTGEHEARDYLAKLAETPDLSDFCDPERLKSPAKVRAALKARGIKIKEFPDGLTETHANGYKLVSRTSKAAEVNFADGFVDFPDDLVSDDESDT